MSATSRPSDLAADRRRRMLITALGADIASAMRDPLVIEIMVNPDGALRLDRLGEGRTDTEIRIEPEQVERIIRLVASHARAEVHAEHPIISAELPPHIEGRAGERFEGVLPPVSSAPCFSIRKPAQKLHTLDDYVADGLMSETQADALRAAVTQRYNILVAGGTSSGKTTLANALLAEMAWVDARVILIEDTRELQCPLPDTVALRTRPPQVSMTDLVRSTMRLRPDRIIVGEVRGPERVVSPADNDPLQQSVAAGRLRKLKAMDLAEDIGGGRYRLAPGLEDTLRRMGERGDIIRLMQRELTVRRLDRAGVEQVVATELREPIVGRVIRRGFSDEHRDRHYLMVDGADGRVHYVDIGRGDATPSVPEGATVRIEATKLEATQADRTVDAIARANGGRYSIDLHLRHDPNASEAFATSHVRRLEAMRRAGAGPERLADGSWTISDDHLAQAEAYSQRQQRDRPVTLSILSRTPVAELSSHEAPTWLDRQLAEGDAHAPRDIGFGREVRTALAARRQWLIEQQLATGEREGFMLRHGAVDTLRARELQRAGNDFANRLGKRFEPARMGERIAGVIARRVDLESGPHALVERSRDFTLVPWRDVLERHIGKAASGILRTDGVSWQIGRGRSGPAIS